MSPKRSRAPRRYRAGAMALSLVTAVGFSGCQSDRPVMPARSAGQGGSDTPNAAATTGGTGALLQRRRDAGIADCPTADSQTPARRDGLPEVTLDCMGADSAVRLAGLRGKPMVINVWAQWCGPCRQEAPVLAQTAAKAGDRVSFLGIDYADPRPDLALDFAQQAGWRYPQLVDPSKAVAPALKIIGPPTTIFVDASGSVTFVHAGPFVSTAQLEQLIGQHLGVSL